MARVYLQYSILYHSLASVVTGFDATTAEENRRRDQISQQIVMHMRARMRHCDASAFDDDGLYEVQLTLGLWSDMPF